MLTELLLNHWRTYEEPIQVSYNCIPYSPGKYCDQPIITTIYSKGYDNYMEFKRYNKNIKVNGIDVTAEITITR